MFLNLQSLIRYNGTLKHDIVPINIPLPNCANLSTPVKMYQCNVYILLRPYYFYLTVYEFASIYTLFIY